MLFLTVLLTVVGVILLATGVAHLARPEVMARQLGWTVGGPFQRVVAIWNLAVGAIAVASPWTSEGFRRAAAVATGVFWIGAACVHVGELQRGREQRTSASVPTALVEVAIGIALGAGVIVA